MGCLICFLCQSVNACSHKVLRMGGWCLSHQRSWVLSFLRFFLAVSIDMQQKDRKEGSRGGKMRFLLNRGERGWGCISVVRHTRTPRSCEGETEGSRGREDEGSRREGTPHSYLRIWQMKQKRQEGKQAERCKIKARKAEQTWRKKIREAEGDAPCSPPTSFPLLLNRQSIPPEYSFRCLTSGCTNRRDKARSEKSKRLLREIKKVALAPSLILTQTKGNGNATGWEKGFPS
mmetsp:Transcript_12684/g.24699  ORF Transcript_12684/g.24699 Transcript_12684/m.24699 type:complete len:232 (-) Transcript_12684:910-1605(-)